MIEARRSRVAFIHRQTSESQRDCRRGVVAAVWQHVSRAVGEDPPDCHILWRAVMAQASGVRLLFPH